MRIRFVTAELSPIAKVGGLADVAGSLPQALLALGHDVRIAMPAYPMAIDSGTQFQTGSEFECQLNAGWKEQIRVLTGEVGGVPIDLLEVGDLFDSSVSSETLYQTGCDPYLAFCAAVLEYDLQGVWHPHVVHCNDWHTGLLPLLMRQRNRGHWSPVGSIFTIHNLAYQGTFGLDVLDKLALPHTLFNHHQLEFYGGVNFLKAGCVFADEVNTVSERYSKEIQTQEFGCRLDGLMSLLHRQGRLSGILNGIDDVEFNPATDPVIAARFDASNLVGKSDCRADLLGAVGMEPIEGAMLIGVVSRLSNQKGIDLLIEAVEQISALPCQLVVQGVGDEWLSSALSEIEQALPSHFRLINRFDIPMAQRVYAGVDAFLMPSAYEPCGLGQMIAMQYGSVPIVRETGGLADTVREGRNGFTFTGKSQEELLGAVRRAHSTFGVNSAWRELQVAGMKADFSWATSALRYVELYRKAIESRSEAQRLTA